MDGDRVKGKLKQGEGKLTGDPDRTNLGKEQETRGKVKDKARDAKDATKDKVEDAKDKIT